VQRAGSSSTGPPKGQIEVINFTCAVTSLSDRDLEMCTCLTVRCEMSYCNGVCIMWNYRFRLSCVHMKGPVSRHMSVMCTLISLAQVNCPARSHEITNRCWSF